MLFDVKLSHRQNMISLDDDPFICRFLYHTTISTLYINSKALLERPRWQSDIECCSLDRKLHTTTLQRYLLDNISWEDQRASNASILNFRCRHCHKTRGGIGRIDKCATRNLLCTITPQRDTLHPMTTT